MIREGRRYTKINGSYTYYENRSPALTDLKTIGDTWLDTSTGDSYRMDSDNPVEWVAIDQGLDAKINQRWDGFLASVSGALNNRFDVKMSGRDCLAEAGCFPSTYRTDCLVDGAETALKSRIIYGVWEIDGAVISCLLPTGIDTFVPAVGQVVSTSGLGIYGSRFFVVADYLIDEDGTIVIELDQELPSSLSSAAGWIYLASIPEDFLFIVGEMFYYDLVTSASSGAAGIKSESIGAYSYTKESGADLRMIGGLRYPSQITSRLEQYRMVSIGGC